MSVTYFAQAVVAHEAALVDIAAYAVDVALAGILPHQVFVAVGQHGLVAAVLRYHELVVLELSLQIGVIEIGIGIEQGLAVVGALDKAYELGQRVDELLALQAAACLDVDHRYEVLLLRAALREEVLQLSLLWDSRTVEMIRAHLEPVAVSQFDVPLIFVVDSVAPLGRFQVDIGHLGLADGFPEDVALIVAEVDAVYMRACVFAFDALLGPYRKCSQ